MGVIGKLNRTGMEACKKGKFDEAEANLLSALGLSQTSKGVCTKVKIHNNLGIVYELQGRHEKAMDHYRNALEIVKLKAAANHPLHVRLSQSLKRVKSTRLASG
jgi:tetratricopeptide (TPR) repeat protein